MPWTCSQFRSIPIVIPLLLLSVGSIFCTTIAIDSAILSSGYPSSQSVPLQFFLDGTVYLDSKLYQALQNRQMPRYMDHNIDTTMLNLLIDLISLTASLSLLNIYSRDIVHLALQCYTWNRLTWRPHSNLSVQYGTFASGIVSIFHLAAWVLLILATKCIPILSQSHPPSESIH
jgi:hypothetical protein